MDDNVESKNIVVLRRISHYTHIYHTYPWVYILKK